MSLRNIIYEVCTRSKKKTKTKTSVKMRIFYLMPENVSSASNIQIRTKYLVGQRGIYLYIYIRKEVEDQIHIKIGDLELYYYGLRSLSKESRVIVA